MNGSITRQGQDLPVCVVSRSKYGDYDIKGMVNSIACADGKHDLLEISEIIGVAVKELIPVIEKLKQHELLETAGV